MVNLHTTEYDGLVNLFGATIAEDYLNRLDLHIASTGKKYVSHYATIYKWITEDKRKAEGKASPDKPKPNKFNNFKQRERSASDYAELEKLERAYLDNLLEGNDGDEDA